MRKRPTTETYKVITRYDNNIVRQIIKVSTFERRGNVVHTCVDYNTGFTRPVKGKSPFRYKAVKDFTHKCNCLTVNYYRNGEYRYTCRTWSPALTSTQTIEKEF